MSHSKKRGGVQIVHLDSPSDDSTSTASIGAEAQPPRSPAKIHADGFASRSIVEALGLDPAFPQDDPLLGVREIVSSTAIAVLPRARAVDISVHRPSALTLSLGSRAVRGRPKLEIHTPATPGVRQFLERLVERSRVLERFFDNDHIQSVHMRLFDTTEAGIVTALPVILTTAAGRGGLRVTTGLGRDIAAATFAGLAMESNGIIIEAWGCDMPYGVISALLRFVAVWVPQIAAALADGHEGAIYSLEKITVDDPGVEAIRFAQARLQRTMRDIIGIPVYPGALGDGARPVLINSFGAPTANPRAYILHDEIYPEES